MHLISKQQFLKVPLTPKGIVSFLYKNTGAQNWLTYQILIDSYLENFSNCLQYRKKAHQYLNSVIDTNILKINSSQSFYKAVGQIKCGKSQILNGYQLRLIEQIDGIIDHMNGLPQFQFNKIPYFLKRSQQALDIKVRDYYNGQLSLLSNDNMVQSILQIFYAKSQNSISNKQQNLNDILIEKQDYTSYFTIAELLSTPLSKSCVLQKIFQKYSVCQFKCYQLILKLFLQEYFKKNLTYYNQQIFVQTQKKIKYSQKFFKSNLDFFYRNFTHKLTQMELQLLFLLNRLIQNISKSMNMGPFPHVLIKHYKDNENIIAIEQLKQKLRPIMVQVPVKSGKRSVKRLVQQPDDQ